MLSLWSHILGTFSRVLHDYRSLVFEAVVEEKQGKKKVVYIMHVFLFMMVMMKQDEFKYLLLESWVIQEKIYYGSISL